MRLATAALCALAITQRAAQGDVVLERGAVPPSPVRARANHIVVKFKPTLAACVHCSLERGTSFVDANGSEGLARLNPKYAARSARPLFFHADASGNDRAATYRSRLDATRKRFPTRAARAAAGAPTPDLSNVFLLELRPGTDVYAAATAYAADPAVEYAHPDYELQTTFIPNDPFYSSAGSWGQRFDDLWGLKITDAATAWDTSTGTGTVAAIIDTGVDPMHVDLQQNLWRNPGEIAGNGIDDDSNGFVDDIHGWDFVDNDADPDDEFGHGTHVAGTVAATGNDAVGMLGMAWGARIMSVRGLDENGRGYESDLAQSIMYAAENGADVLNNSWGGFSFYLAVGMPSAVADAVQAAASLGVVVVASAGNAHSNVSSFEPAGYPEAIAVGATDHQDQVASFSNFGPALSVAAPGVDVLSARARRGSALDPYGYKVERDYLALSGTSMAAPHVTGVSALLLSLFPSLSRDEVRWHLELNSDQPGYEGFEGQPWNPYFGWGRVNAARVFDTPPITTRLSGRVEVHTYTDTVMSNVATADVGFTTADPVAWTLATPAWLMPSATAGGGPTHFTVDVDAAGLDVGSYDGRVQISAPMAVDGGAGFPVRLHTHHDPRIGPLLRISDNHQSTIAPDPPMIASDGVGSLLVWEGSKDHTTGELFAARIDGAGNVDGPFTVDTRPYHIPYNPRLGFDGRNYLAAWAERKLFYHHSSTFHEMTIRALRLSSTGEALDDAPVVLRTVTVSTSASVSFFPLGVVFEGDQYAVFWTEGKGSSDRVYVQYIGTDGTVRGKPIRLGRALAARNPRFVGMKPVCLKGKCLLVWGNRTGESVANYYKDSINAVRFRAGEILDETALPVLSNVNIGISGLQLVDAGDRIGVFAGRVVCADETDPASCRFIAAFTHMNNEGVSENPEGLVLSNEGFPMRSVAYDGENYVGVFVGVGTLRGTQVFASQFAPSGQALSDEEIGMLLLPQSIGVVAPAYGTSMAPVISNAPRSSLLAWVDTIDHDPGAPNATWSSPVAAQRVLPRAPSSRLPQREVGGIGDLAAAERQELKFALSASTLGAGEVTFSGSNLPAGAIVDPSGVFRWMPDSLQSGVYAAVHIEATDGVQTVSEDVTITVGEANLALAGTMMSAGAPVGGLTFQVRRNGVTRTLTTSSLGSFRLDDLVPGDYRIRLLKPGSRQVANPGSITIGSSDRTDVVVSLAPK